MTRSESGDECVRLALHLYAFEGSLMNHDHERVQNRMTGMTQISLLRLSAGNQASVSQR